MPPKKPNVQRIAKKPGDEQPKVGIKVDGRLFVVELTEVSALDAAAVRAAIGMSVPQLLDVAKEAGDLDIIAALVFLARRQAGESEVTYYEIASTLTYKNHFANATKKDLAEAAADPQL